MQQHWLEAMSEQCDCELEVFRQSLFDKKISFGQISVEDEIEVLRVDGDLVSDRFFLVV